MAPEVTHCDFCSTVNLSFSVCASAIVTADPASCATVHYKQRLLEYPATTFFLALIYGPGRSDTFVPVYAVAQSDVSSLHGLVILQTLAFLASDGTNYGANGY